MAKTNKVEEQPEQADTEEQQKQSQMYDTSMKELVDRQVRDILPVLLPGLIYKDTLNVEVWHNDTAREGENEGDAEYVQQFVGSKPNYSANESI